MELENLEERVLLSAEMTPEDILYKPANGQPYQSAAPPTTAYTPQQIRSAYGIDQLYGIIGNGAGQTIAIVDAYDDPAFLDSNDPNFASSDLHQFDVQFGLPDPPNFIKLNQTGGTALPGTDPAGPSATGDWETEESLDVEWAHALAPGANIILFEANSPSDSDLYTAAATAANTPGVSVVSMSFGGPEYSTESNQDNIFTTPAGHQGVTFLAASGDTGAPGGYPAYSPNVVAVGGTTLTINASGGYGGETAWSWDGTNASGGGTSQYEPEPSYQQSVQSTGKRTIPDVAFDANPASGVAIYDSYDFGASTPWAQFGGTSFACPSWGALIAIADEGLAARGEDTLDGPSQTLPKLYLLEQTQPSYFHDITSGNNNGFSAGPGYDEVTGLGSPAANLLIPALLGLQVQPLPVAATEGQLLNNAAIATFTDPTGSQPVSDYSIAINWGDGSVTNGTAVSDGGDLYTVYGTHTYVNAGTYPVTVTVNNTVNELQGIATGSIVVADAPLKGSAQALNTVAGGFVSNALAAVFVDTDTTPRAASHYSATIQWFEGNGLSFSSTGSIVPLSGTNVFAVYGSSPYTFPSGGLYTVRVVVTDLDGGASVTIDSVLNVAHNGAIPPLTPMYQSDAEPISSPFAAMEDALTNLLQAERLFFVGLSIGTMQQKQGSFANLVNAYMAYQAAIMQFDMQLPGS